MGLTGQQLAVIDGSVGREIGVHDSMGVAPYAIVGTVERIEIGEHQSRTIYYRADEELRCIGFNPRYAESGYDGSTRYIDVEIQIGGGFMIAL